MGGYDELNRLTYVKYDEESGPDETQAYTFDNMGNRLTMNSDTYQYNNANMLRYRNQNEYTYDANGNNLTGGGRANTWDSQNRLRQCVYGTTTSTFTYGSDGLRRSMTIGNDPTVYYALDSQNVAQEGHLDQYNEFVPDVTYLSGPRGVEYRLDDATGQMRWYLYDGLGSVVAEVDENGYITATRKYDVYGSVRGETGTPVGDQKFCGSLGHTQENATGPTDFGLIYMRARWMDPVLGRFISEDPAKDGNNWFTYAGNNPVNLTDSTGMFLDLLLGELLGLKEEAGEGAAANAVKQWGVDKIYQAVAYHSGEITGYLLAGELTSGISKAGIYIKNVNNGRQIHIDLLGRDWQGRAHIDFQPDQIGGPKYAKLFLQGLVRGLGF